MNPGLVWLLRRSPITLTRALRRRFKGARGVLLALGLAFVLFVLIAPQVADTLLRERDLAQTARRARLYGPLSLLLMAGMTILAPAQRRGGLYFRPAEVAMLFPAPVTRRELLAYHVLARAQITILSGLWVTLFVARYAPTWLGCLLGVTLALLFLQLLAQAVALLTAAAGKRLAWPLRWGLLLATLVVLALGGIDALAAARLDAGAEAVVGALREHPAVAVLTLPFVPFARTYAALSFGEACLWAAVSSSLVVVLALLVARLDVAYEEAALEVSRNVRRRLERMSAGGGALAALGPSRARFSVPRLPFLSGAGPVAWRQCVEIVRNGRAVLTSLLLLLLWPAIMGGAVLTSELGAGDGAGRIAAFVLPMLLVFSVVSTQNIGFDFRRDLDRIPFLRSLPVASFAVAAGQIGPSAVLLALLQWISIGVIVASFGLLPPVAIVAILPALLPAAWAVLAVDNLLFLMFPHRIDPDDAGNVGFVGKLMLVMSLKFVILGALVLVAGGVGAAAAFLWSQVVGGADAFPGVQAVLVGAFVAMGIVVAADVLLTWLVARAYAAFDGGGLAAR